MKSILPIMIVAALAQAALADLGIIKEVPPPPPVPTGEHKSLPQKHEYQKQLRGFMATLKEADFLPNYKDLTLVATGADANADDAFRTWILAMTPPAVGYKRNYSSVMVHSALFTVPIIEGEKSILRPPAHAEALADLADWNYAGNPYYNSRALRLRAFALCAIDMIMLDDLLEAGDEKDKPNQDTLAGMVLRFAYVYPGFQNVVPAEVGSAYLAGLKKLTTRLLEGTPRSLPKTLGLLTTAAPALALATRLLNDPAVTQKAEDYARKIYTEPLFSPAGYFPFGGTLDSFNGIALHFGAWGAISSDWPFARDAMARAHRLRAHLTLADPDGYLLGPSHMASLTSAEPIRDQWNWANRTWTAALVSDEAACMTKMPDGNVIAAAPAAVVASVNGGIHEMSWTPGGLDPTPWKCAPPGSFVNFAYRYYPKGYYARRVALEKTDLARLPVLREESFIRRFGDEFLVAKTQSHELIIHTGPITDPADTASGAGYGFGGGALSAFWTKASGAVILGRGIGAWAPQYKTAFDAWRSLPSHAVIGITAAGKVFTSAHINKPETAIDANATAFTIVAAGPIPPSRQGEMLLAGTLDYTRKFESAPTGVRITTTVKSDGKDAIAELYEAIPVFLREAGQQPNATPTSVEFQVDGAWSPATETSTSNVTAARLRRFDGAVDVIFDRPSRVKLAPEWRDKYLTAASCRNILIDLLETDGAPAAANSVRKTSYRIEPAVK